MPDASIVAHCLMASRLSETSTASVYAAIVQGARRRNPAEGISGALIFDGERFCHFIEGAVLAVKALCSRLEQDHRHTSVQVLSSGSGARQFTAWHSGYCDPGDLDAFMGEDASVGVQALAKFMALAQRCDLSA